MNIRRSVSFASGQFLTGWRKFISVFLTMTLLAVYAPPLATQSVLADNFTAEYQAYMLPNGNYSGATDSWINSGGVNNNYGSDSTLQILKTLRKTLMKWDISDLPSDAQVTGASLTYFVENDSGSNTFQAYELKKQWIESAVTWKKAGSDGWDVDGALGANDRGSVVLADITGSALGSTTVNFNTAGIAVIQSWVDNPLNNHGILIEGTLWNSNNDLRISSKEATTQENRPKLTIQYDALPDYDAQFVSQNVPATMDIGQTYQVSVTMENTGRNSWSDVTGEQLASQNPEGNTTWGLSSVGYDPSSDPTPTNGQKEFIFTITAPSTPGDYDFQWQMADNLGNSFGEVSTNAVIAVVDPTPLYDAQFISQNIPVVMDVGQTYEISVTMQNTGQNTWSDTTGEVLTSQNPAGNTTWGLSSVGLGTGESVARNEQKEFTFTVTAPGTPGDYNFQWQMNDGTSYFGEISTNVVISVVDPTPLYEAQFISQNVPATMNVGQTYQVSVTMQNTGQNTWSDTTGEVLASQNPAGNTTWGLSSVGLGTGESVARNEQKIFTFTVTAPGTPGDYNFQWQMNDGTSYFGEISTNVVVSVINPAPSYDAEFISQDVPVFLFPSETRTISVSMKNTGTSDWIGGFGLKSQNPAGNDTWGVVSKLLTIDADPVLSGNTATFSLTITAPSTPGTYDLQWQMIDSLGAYFGETTPNVPVLVNATAPQFHAEFISQDVPVKIIQGGYYNLSITMKNAGSSPWDSSFGNFRLTSQNPPANTTWGVTGKGVGEDGVLAGDEKEFYFTITAPSTLGIYDLQWQMSDDLTTYFGEKTPNVKVEVVPPEYSPPVQDNLTTSAIWTTDGTSTYDITLVATDAGSGVRDMLASVNYQGDNSTNNRGRFGWRADDYYWNFDVSEFMPCTGGGFAQKYEGIDGTPAGYGQDFISLVGCSTTLVGAQRTVIFTVQPHGDFGEFTDNDISMYAEDYLGNPTGWVNHDLNFSSILPPYSAEFVSQNVPSTMEPGAQATVSITLKNTGSNTWTQAAGYKLGSQNPQDNTTWGMNRVELDSADSITWGQEKTFTFTVTAPSTPGTYNLQWQMLQEGGQWFGDLTQNAQINVSLLPPALYLPTQVLHFSFEEAAGTTVVDQTILDNDGVLGGDAKRSVGRFGQGAYLDGTGAFVSTSLTVNQTNTIGNYGATFATWVYPYSLSDDPNENRHIISTNNGGDDWAILQKNGTWQIMTGAGIIDTGFMVDVEAWQHVAATFLPGAGVYFYKNGKEFFISSIGADTSTGPVNIGQSPLSGGYFDGIIDEVRVFNPPAEGHERILRIMDGLKLDLSFEGTGNGIYEEAWFTQGILKNGAARTTAGKNGQGIILDGINDFIELFSDDDSLEIKNYTVSAWIKPDGQPNEPWKGIIGKPGRNYNIWVTQDGAIHHRFHTTLNTNDGISDTPLGVVQWNQWNHIVITNDGVTAKTYVNGVEEASGSINGRLVIDDTPLYIGKDLDGGDWRYFKGTIDEVRIYDRALSQMEVEDLQDQDDDEKGLVAHYDFTESSGDTVFDQTDNGHHAYIQGGTWSEEYQEALHLDGSGSQFLQVPADPDFDFTGDYTVTAWIQPDSDALSSIAGIIGKKNPYGWGLNLVDGKVNFGYHNCQNFSGNTLLTAGEWYFVAGVFSTSGDDHVYVSKQGDAFAGIPDESSTHNLTNGNCGNDTSDLVIGRWQTNPAQDFSGLISNVRIYNRALSGGELASNYTKATGDSDSLTVTNLDVQGARGMINDGAFSLGDFDAVNTMTGNLLVKMPIGQSYKVGPSLSYGLSLIYNSSVAWEAVEIPYSGHGPGTYMSAAKSAPLYSLNAAGVGWRLNIPELYTNLDDCSDPNGTPGCALQNWPNRSKAPWRYIAADGSPIDFYEKAGSTNVFISYGSPTTRLNATGTDVKVELSDGTIHTFEYFSGGDCGLVNSLAEKCTRIKSISDRYGNIITFTYSGYDGSNPAPTIEITDSIAPNRKTTITFSRKEGTGEPDTPFPGTEGGDFKMVVDFITVPTFNGQTKTYNISYVFPGIILRGCPGSGNVNEQDWERFVTVPLLSSITRPEDNGITYFDHSWTTPPPISQATPYCDETAGKLTKITFPTGAQVEYEYTDYYAPSPCNTDPIGSPLSIREHGLFSATVKSKGIRVRRELNAAGVEKSRKEYIHNLGASDLTHSTTTCMNKNLAITDIIQYPQVDGKYLITRQWATVTKTDLADHPADMPLVSRHWYGKPITLSDRTAITDDFGNKLYLSNRTGLCNTPVFSSACDVQRATYLRYAMKPSTNTYCDSDFVDTVCQNLESVLIGKRELYGNKHIDTQFSQYNGWGYLKKMETTSNFPTNYNTTTTTNYTGTISTVPINSDGMINGNLLIPSNSTPWLPGLLDQVKQEMNGDTKIEKYTFNGTTGFLECKRTLKNNANNNTDIATVYTNGGNGRPSFVRTRGGDGGTASCGDTGTDQYILYNTYLFGELATSIAKQSKSIATSQNIGPLLVDNTIDENTGFVSKSCDNSVSPKKCTDLTYDGFGRLTSQAPESLADVEYAYTLNPTDEICEVNGHGGKVVITIKEGTTEYDQAEVCVDEFGRTVVARAKAGTIAADWVKQKTNYDAYDRVSTETTVQEEDGFLPSLVTTNVYDSFGRLTSMTNPQGDVIKYGYDDPDIPKKGSIHYTEQIHTVQLASGEKEVKEVTIFDNLRRPVEIQEGAVNSGTVANPNWGNPVRKLLTSFSGDQVIMQLRPGAVTTPNQSRSTDVDGRGFVTSETLPEWNSNTATYEYDSHGNTTKQTYPGGLVITYSYDKAGRLKTVTAGGKTLKEFEYYGDSSVHPGKLLKTTRHNVFTSANTFGYDFFIPAGQTESDFKVIEEYFYDSKGFLSQKDTSVVQDNSSSSLYETTQNWTYDDLGRLETMTYPSCTTGCGSTGAPARTLTYEYDNGDLQFVKEGGNKFLEFEYYGNGVTDRILYYKNGSHKTTDKFYTVGTDGRSIPQTEEVRVNNSNGTNLWKTGTYAYDGSGNLTDITNGTDYSASYKYDSLSRLTTATGPGIGTYGYNIFDSLTASPGTPFTVSSSTNRLATVNSTAVTYDSRGNLTSWDCHNFSYDATNHRIAQSCINNGVIIYQGLNVYNASDQVVVTLDRFKSPNATNANGTVSSAIISPVDDAGVKHREFRQQEYISTENPQGGKYWEYTDYAYTGNALRAIDKGSGWVHAHVDYLSSVRALTTDSLVTATQSYTPYGEKFGGDSLNIAPGFAGHSTDRNNLNANHPDDLDGAGMTMNFGARSYFQEVGRFMSVDSVQDGWNKYTYARNNPLKFVDSQGSFAAPAICAGALPACATAAVGGLSFAGTYALLEFTGANDVISNAMADVIDFFAAEPTLPGAYNPNQRGRIAKADTNILPVDDTGNVIEIEGGIPITQMGFKFKMGTTDASEDNVLSASLETEAGDFGITLNAHTTISMNGDLILGGATISATPANEVTTFTLLRELGKILGQYLPSGASIILEGGAQIIFEDENGNIIIITIPDDIPIYPDQ